MPADMYTRYLFNLTHTSPFVKYSMHGLVCTFTYLQRVNFFCPQRASFSLRVSVVKAKSLMAKDANGETSQASNEPLLSLLKMKYFWEMLFIDAG